MSTNTNQTHYIATTDRKGLGSGNTNVPVLDEKTLKELGERRIKGFRHRIEKTLNILHPERNETTTRERER